MDSSAWSVLLSATGPPLSPARPRPEPSAPTRRWAAPRTGRPASPWLLPQLVRRRKEVRGEDQVLDRLPVDARGVQPKSNPTLGPDVRGNKVPAWVFRHKPI